jgi:hypothetical protein
MLGDQGRVLSDFPDGTESWRTAAVAGSLSNSIVDQNRDKSLFTSVHVVRDCVPQ